MADSKPSDTVPNLGFKDKEKALETIKELEGRDPDYQKLAIKGLIGRANRVLTITKAEDKLKNIKDALKVFDDWLREFEKLNLGKDNRAYLPFATIKSLKPLKSHYKIDDTNIDSFLEAYENQAEGEYKKLRTVESAADKPTWDIVRNTNLKRLLKAMDENDNVAYWTDDGLPSKEHTELILWAYSPEAPKIKKQLSSLEEKIGSLGLSEKKDDSLKRKSASGDSSEESDDESPKKKKRSNSSSNESD